MTVSSRGLNFHLGVEHVDNTVSTPESWARFTEENIKRSTSERIQSEDYMNAADNLMKEVANDIWSQWNTVNASFEQRIYECNEAKEKIQNHLNAVRNTIFTQNSRLLFF